jgi:hypothetical protein
MRERYFYYPTFFPRIYSPVYVLAVHPRGRRNGERLGNLTREIKTGLKAASGIVLLALASLSLRFLEGTVIATIRYLPSRGL